MQFDKPKVTIDLEEYQYLKEQETKINTDDWYNVARKVAFAFRYLDNSMLFRMGDVMKYLKESGIHITSKHLGSRENTFENIEIKINNGSKT